METTKTIIKYTLEMIQQSRFSELKHRLQALLDVLNTMEYSWDSDKAIKAVCKIEEAETDAPDV